MEQPIFIGYISKEILSIIGINKDEDVPVYLGESNIKHIQSKHPDAYAVYGMDIKDIVTDPDYVGINPKDQSIECVKEYLIDGEFVKVAVRSSAHGKCFVRSLYVLNKNRVRNFIACGALKKVKF